MKRFILEELIKWKKSKYRKPLILKGARQIGKTYILKKFGEENYKDVAYFNFDHDEDLYNLFENTKDPQRILEQFCRTFCRNKYIVSLLLPSLAGAIYRSFCFPWHALSS